MTRRFIALEKVLEMHRGVIETFGGSHGVRDRGSLESAILRPQMGYYDGLIEEAAALMESLSQNHPFIDGNKRVAFYATDAFLRLNGYYIDCDNEAAHDFFMELYATSSFRFVNLVPWLTEHVKPLS